MKRKPTPTKTGVPELDAYTTIIRVLKPFPNKTKLKIITAASILAGIDMAPPHDTDKAENHLLP